MGVCLSLAAGTPPPFPTIGSPHGTTNVMPHQGCGAGDRGRPGTAVATASRRDTEGPCAPTATESHRDTSHRPSVVGFAWAPGGSEAGSGAGGRLKSGALRNASAFPGRTGRHRHSRGSPRPR